MRALLFHKPEPNQVCLMDAWIQLLTDHLGPRPTQAPLPWQLHGWVWQNRKETKQLPIKLWSFPKHCSSYISLVSVWACGWSWSYIHTLGSGLFGRQIGHSQTLRIPSVREKGFILLTSTYMKKMIVYKSISLFQHESAVICCTTYVLYLIKENPNPNFNTILRTERLHFHFSLSFIGEGNGNPLQCSCLENPRDGGAWWAAVYGVAQSWTRLKQLSSSSSRIHYFYGIFF